MSTIRVGGVRFRVYPQDHEPVHVHALVGDGHVIVDLTDDRRVVIAERANAVRNVKSSEVRKVLDLAAANFDELKRLWEQMNG